MNTIGFIRLMRNIYGNRPADIEMIQNLGLLAVKIGQIHALRIDFLDEEKCRQLSQLYRSARSIPAEDFHDLVEAHGGSGWLSNFKSIDEKPVASASIGQVHRGVLNSGEIVAVKLVKKDFTNGFQKDVQSVERLFKFLVVVYPRLKRVGNPLGILDDIKTYTLSELDLTSEIKGQATLKRLAEDNGSFDLSHLRWLNMYPSLSNRNILVSQFMDAPSFDELLERNKLDYGSLMELFRIFGYYTFKTGTFHGDIHPGNVMLDGSDIYFVDNGSLGHVPDKLRIGLLRFFEELSTYNFKDAARALNAMSEKQLSGKKYENYETRFLDLYEDFPGSTVSQVSLTKKMMETIKMGVIHGMDFDKGTFAVIRALMYLDGMVLRCKPNAVLMEDIGQSVQEFKEIV